MNWLTNLSARAVERETLRVRYERSARQHDVFLRPTVHLSTMQTGHLVVRKTGCRKRGFFDGSAGISELSSLRTPDQDSLNGISDLG